MLLKTKLANLLKAEAAKQNVEIEIFLSNISVNGSMRGCSGHVVNKSTGSCVYLDTESSVYGPLSDKVLYRLAKDTSDFSSVGLVNGYNRWCKPENLACSILSLLVREKAISKKSE